MSAARWSRAVVADALGWWPQISRPWVLDRTAAVLPAEVDRITGACIGLNAAARSSHVLGQVVPEVAGWVLAVADCAESSSVRAAAPCAPLRPPAPPCGVPTEPRRPVSGHQTALITIWLSDAEHDRWAAAAACEGYDQVSAWARRLIGMRLDWEVPAPIRSASSGLVEVHRQIGGALANAAQMGDLAADCGDIAVAEAIAAAAERIAAGHLALGRAAR